MIKQFIECKKKYSKEKIITAFRFFMIICIITVFGMYVYDTINYFRNIKDIETVGEMPSCENVVGEMVKDSKVKQNFLAEGKFKGVEICMATYSKSSIDSNLEYTFINSDTKEKLYTGKINTSSIRDNSVILFETDKEYHFSEKTNIAMEIKSLDGAVGESVSFWCSLNDEYTDGELIVNDITNAGDLAFRVVTGTYKKDNNGVIFYRILFIFMICCFIAFHFIFNIRKMYDFIFKYRYLIAFIIFAFLTLNKIHFSSISMFDKYVQPNEGSQYINPILGEARAIRSDEWLVTTPRKLTVQYEGMGKYNSIPRAKKTTNLSASGLYFNYGSLAQLNMYGYYLFDDIEYGIAYQWNFLLIVSFMVSFEMCMILSNKNKGVSLFGAILLAFSSYTLWWSYALWTMSCQGALVSANYFINTKNRKMRVLYGILFALFTACFVVELYPAWQVPVGYACIVIAIWMIVTNKDKFAKFGKKDWAILGGTIVFLLSIVVVYFINYSEYMKEIMDTEYPGTRISCGEFRIDKLFGYIASFLFPFIGVPNPSESGVFVTFFPVPIVLAIYYICKSFIKKEKKDLFLISLTVLCLFYIVYCTIGVSESIAKFTLMSYSFAHRTVDVIGFLQIYIMIYILGRIEFEDRIKCIYGEKLVIVSITCASLYTSFNFVNYLPLKIILVCSIIFIVIVECLFCRVKEFYRKFAMIILGGMVFISGISVNPVTRGLDVIYSKPVYKEIEKIVKNDKEGKWIACDGNVNSGYLIASGARTINSVNYVPNYELWDKLNADISNEIYDRYAHIIVDFTEGKTSAELVHLDCIRLNLSYDDFEKIDVKYIYSNHELQDTEKINFIEKYNYAGSIIYEVEYIS